MSKKHKEYIAIIVIFIALLGGYFLVQKMSAEKVDDISKLEVRFKDEVLQTIDLNVDGVYEIEVTLGHMYVHVENEEYWVEDVDCPDKICEKFGRVKKGSPTLIACLPNNIVLVQG